jgi:hypothetical protein
LSGWQNVGMDDRERREWLEHLVRRGLLTVAQAEAMLERDG